MKTLLTLAVALFVVAGPSAMVPVAPAQDADVTENATAPSDVNEPDASPAPNPPSPAPETREPAPAPGDTDRAGFLIRVPQPVTSAAVRRIQRFTRGAIERARAAGEKPVLVYEFAAEEDRIPTALGSDFGDCYDLARFLSSDATAGAHTVAYVSTAVVGHAVLVAMACEDIMAASDATIGPVDLPADAATPTIRSAYREIADRRGTVDEAVALWLVDPTLDVKVVDKTDGREIMTAEQLAERRKTETVTDVQSLSDVSGGGPGVLRGNEGRHFGIIDYKPRSTTDLASELRVPPASLREDPTLIGDTRAVLVMLRGPIRPGLGDQIARLMTQKVRETDANLVVLWIDSPGGLRDQAVYLANAVAELGPDVRTVAYVPSEALSDAALVATACDDLIMGPNARIGGSGAFAFSQDDIRLLQEVVSDPRGAWRHRSWSLIAAMINPELEVYRCTRDGNAQDVEYFCDQELAQRAAAADNGPQWVKQQLVTTPGKLFSCDGVEAVEYNLASETAEDLEGLKQIYAIENDPTFAEPTWVDSVVETLASPALAVVLLTIGIVALYAELSMPGIGVGGFIATVCFLLFFWSQFLGGTANWLEVLLFVAGICCLLIELFVLPGFGIFGFGGAVMVLVSVFLATQTFLQVPQNEYQFTQLRNGIYMFGGVAVGTVVLISLLQRWVPEASIFRGNLILEGEGEAEEDIKRREAGDRHAHLVGKIGTATTQLTPSGKAVFDGRLVSVIADGTLIKKDQQVRVVNVQGNRIFVEPVQEETT